MHLSANALARMVPRPPGLGLRPSLVLAHKCASTLPVGACTFGRKRLVLRTSFLRRGRPPPSAAHKLGSRGKLRQGYSVTLRSTVGPIIFVCWISDNFFVYELVFDE